MGRTSGYHKEEAKRLPAVDTDRKYESTVLQDNHREVLRLIALGKKPKEIAARTGLSPQQISNVRNSGLGRAHLQHLQAEMDGEAIDIRKRFQELAPTAVSKMTELMLDAEDQGLQGRMAESILDRAGYSPVKRTEAFTRNENVTVEVLAEIKNRVDNEKRNGNGISLGGDGLEEIPETTEYTEVTEEEESKSA